MWHPICEVVELERPLLKAIYKEIEDLFDGITDKHIGESTEMVGGK